MPDRYIRETFYGECSDEDVALARLLLSPEPTLPFTTPLTVTDENFGRVPRVYIECLRDKAIAPALQKQVHRACLRQRFDASHGPFTFPVAAR
jgi:hypothetical protein